jgi:hypothetical protein
MLRPFEDLVRFLRRHSPGGRERLALRLLHSIVVEPVPRAAPTRAENGHAARTPARS